jgi:hypothetical protein
MLGNNAEDVFKRISELLVCDVVVTVDVNGLIQQLCLSQ